MLVNCVAYEDGRKLADIDLRDIHSYLARPGCFVWVALKDATEAELETMREEFDLHELAVEDAHTAHQRPKIEIYGDSLFIVVHTAQVISGKIAFGETHIFMGRNYLVTIRHGASLSYAVARRGC